MAAPTELGNQSACDDDDLLYEFAIDTRCTRKETIEWMTRYPNLAARIAHHAFMTWAEENEVDIVSPENKAAQFKFFVEAWKLPLKGDDDGVRDGSSKTTQAFRILDPSPALPIGGMLTHEVLPDCPELTPEQREGAEQVAKEAIDRSLQRVASRAANALSIPPSMRLGS